MMNRKYSYWRCPSCHKQPKTLSFRASNNHTNPIFMISNSTYLDVAESSQGDITHPAVDRLDTVEEVMIQELKSSERLLFDPKGATSPLLQEACTNNNDDSNNEDLRYEEDDDIGRARFAFEESTALITVDTKDPFADFRESMKEMIEAHDELREWEDLEELLSLYLKFNGKNTHGYILAAFLDLVSGDDGHFADKAGAASSRSCSFHQESHACTSYDSDSSCDESSS